MVETPVSDGEFRSGPELMLWRPGLDITRLRRRAAYASLLRLPVTCMAFGVGVAIAAVREDGVASAVILVVIGTLLILAGLAASWVNYDCFEYDHRHRHDRLCFLERARGEYFYRPSDFADLSVSAASTVHGIVGAVHEIHCSIAATWLTPHHLHTVHKVAWSTLTVLDHSRALRVAADNARHDAAHGELVQAAENNLAALDRVVNEVLNNLLSVVTLVRAWERKHSEAVLGDRLCRELNSFPDAVIGTTLRAAESAVEETFAYITAARDVTHAGPFAWEEPRRPQMEAADQR